MFVGVGLGLGFQRIPSGGFDADAQAFFDRVTTAGGTLSTTEKTAVNQLVLDMKSANIWTAMKAIYPMVGASAAACAQNLKSSSFTGTFTSGWTFASTGVTPNGVSAYMNTGFNPNSQSVSPSSFHFSIYLRTNIVGQTADIGAEDNNAKINLLPRYSGDITYATIGNVDSYPLGVPFSNNDSKAFWQINRKSLTNSQVYKNEIKKIDGQINSTLIVNKNIYIGAVNYNGNPLLFSVRQNAFASIGDGLTDTQASNFYTAVQAFQTTLSRQV